MFDSEYSVKKENSINNAPCKEWFTVAIYLKMKINSNHRAKSVNIIYY